MRLPVFFGCQAAAIKPRRRPLIPPNKGNAFLSSSRATLRGLSPAALVDSGEEGEAEDEKARRRKQRKPVIAVEACVITP
jgi:hypothetical protein